MTNCYFCKNLIGVANNVRLYNGSMVLACSICRSIVPDTRSASTNLEVRVR